MNIPKTKDGVEIAVGMKLYHIQVERFGNHSFIKNPYLCAVQVVSLHHHSITIRLLGYGKSKYEPATRKKSRVPLTPRTYIIYYANFSEVFAYARNAKIEMSS